MLCFLCDHSPLSVRISISKKNRFSNYLLQLEIFVNELKNYIKEIQTRGPNNELDKQMFDKAKKKARLIMVKFGRYKLRSKVFQEKWKLKSTGKSITLQQKGLTC